MSKAKEQYKREEHEEPSLEEAEHFSLDAYEKMEQRLKMFQETLDAASNETKTFDSPPLAKEPEDEEETLATSKHILPSSSSISKRISASRVRLDLSQLKPTVSNSQAASNLTFERSPSISSVGQAIPIETYPPTPAPSSSTMTTNQACIVSLSTDYEKRPKIIQINSKRFRILQLVGKGGSSKVYKVIGTDFQIYALKKVRLKGLDNATIEGYMNEIDLLHRLASNPWIIRLLDTCIDKEKSILYLLMEFGEVDLASMLAEKKRQYTRLPFNESSHVNFIIDTFGSKSYILLLQFTNNALFIATSNRLISC